MCGLVAEGAGFPMGDGVGFDQTASTVANALQRGCQGCSRDALSAVALVHHEAGDSPEFSTADGESQSLIFPAVVNAGQLGLRTKLAPAHGLLTGIHQNAVCAAFIEERFLFAPVSGASL